MIDCLGHFSEIPKYGDRATAGILGGSRYSFDFAWRSRQRPLLLTSVRLPGKHSHEVILHAVDGGA